jgi:hypothetical protein
MMVGHPFTGEQYLFMEHSGLLSGLTVDQVMLGAGGVKEKKPIRDQQYGTNGYYEFSLQFHSRTPEKSWFHVEVRRIKIEKSLLIGNMFYEKMIPPGNDTMFFFENILKIQG